MANSHWLSIGDFRVGHRLSGHSKRVCDLKWSRDGQFLASASRDRTIRVWNVEHGNLRFELAGHQSDVRSLAWSHDGLLVSGSRDHSVRVWAPKGREVAKFNEHAPIASVACSPSRSLIAIATEDGEVFVKAIPRGDVVSSFSHQGVSCVQWSRDDATILSGSDGGDVRLWSTANAEYLGRLAFDAAVRSATFLVSDTRIAVAGKRPRVTVFDVEHEQPIADLEGHTSEVHCVCPSEDQSVLATQSGAEGRTLIWQCRDWRRVAEFKTSRHRASSTNFAFHPTRRIFAAVARDKNQLIEIWSKADDSADHSHESVQDFDVFLAYNGVNHSSVRKLANAIRDRGLKVWVDAEQLIPGRPWQEALEGIIQSTKTAAVLVGAEGLGPWEHRELRACLSQFVDRKLPVIPVLLPDAPAQPDLPLFLRDFTWVDFRGGFKKETLDLLEWAIKGKKP